MDSETLLPSLIVCVPGLVRLTGLATVAVLLPEPVMLLVVSVTLTVVLNVPKDVYVWLPETVKAPPIPTPMVPAELLPSPHKMVALKLEGLSVGSLSVKLPTATSPVLVPAVAETLLALTLSVLAWTT